jgi:hypothetical protein
MSELEDLLRSKAKSGGLHGVTLFSTIGGWQGNVRYNSDGWRVEFHADPIEALLAALRSDVNFDHARKPEPAPAAPVLTGGLFD